MKTSKKKFAKKCRELHRLIKNMRTWKLAFDKYQIRSSKGIRRYWLLMSLAHFICCTAKEDDGEPFGKFEKGHAFFCRKIQEERIEYLYQCGARNVPLDEVLALVG